MAPDDPDTPFLRDDHARTLRVPVHVMDAITRLVRTARALRSELGREPTREEIATAMALSPRRVGQLRALGRMPLSLEMPVAGGDDGDLGAFIWDLTVPSPADAAEQRALAARMERAPDALNGLERTVLELRIELDNGWARSLDEVGRILGLTRQRVRHLEARALAKLRHRAPDDAPPASA